MIKTLTAAIGGSTLAALLGWFGPTVLADHSDDWPASTALKDAQQQAQRALRRDMAAAALCRGQYGEAGFTWTQDNRLVCIPRRGGRTVVSEAQP